MLLHGRLSILSKLFLNYSATVSVAVLSAFNFKNVIQSIALLKRCKVMYFFNMLFSKYQLFL